MKQFLWAYVNTQSPGTYGKWTAASLSTASALEQSPFHAQVLQERARAFIADRRDLPFNVYGTGKANEFLLDRDKELAQDINLHLQGIGKWVRAMDLVDYLDTPEMRRRTGHTERIHITTAQRWMKRLGYRWKTTPKGQYVDGHKWEDIVAYRQHVFLPVWRRAQARTRDFSREHKEDQPSPLPSQRHTVMWFHDESTFYANDRRKTWWVFKEETALPQPKGEGASQMVADMVSADYGWLRSRDGKHEAQVFFKAGKNREGYFTNDDILEQTNKAMDILKKDYPDEDHVLVFDNAMTHTK
jgi:hypothetical protein